MPEELSTDICVIGGGPGGIAVAMAAVNHGVPAILIEKATLGGANLAGGGVPSQALIAAAASHEALRVGRAMGISATSLQVDFSGIRNHIRSVVAAVAPKVSAERLSALGVRVIPAAAQFVDPNRVAAGDFIIRARRFVVATGAVPMPPAIPGLDRVDHMTPNTLFDLDRPPGHLLVYGAGAHGLELAQAYSRLGVAVTVLDSDRALADVDPELATAVLDRLTAEGIVVRDGVAVLSVAEHENGVRVSTGDSDGHPAIEGTHLLVVVAGRRPNVEDLGLGAAGIAFDPSGIVVDRRHRTTNRSVYAIGDVVAGADQVNRAEYEADRVVRQILYRMPARTDPNLVPAVISTDPALATVGLSEAAALQNRRGARILRLPLAENDLAQAERSPFGMVKVVSSCDGQILGVGVVVRNAGEVITPWSLAIANRLGIDAMLSFVPPYPSRAESSRRIAAGFYGAEMLPSWRRRIVDFLRKFG